MNWHFGFPGDAPAITNDDLYGQRLPRGYIDDLVMNDVPSVPIGQ